LLRWGIHKLAARLGLDGEEILLLGLQLCCESVLVFSGGLLWIAWALLASFVLAFGADTLLSKGGVASVTAPVHTHPDGLLYPLDGRSRRSEPFV